MSTVRVRYQTIEFGQTDIHLRTLRDLREFEDDGGQAEGLGISSATWPLFGVVWESSLILADLMFELELEGRRILEIGCGIALPSLVLNQRGADITATDRHPRAGEFLARNVELNGGPPIPFVRTDWRERDSDLGRFDLLIGSELLYDRDCVDELSSFVGFLANVRCELILVDPGRGNHARFSREMVKLGYDHSQQRPPAETPGRQPFKGQILRYQR